MFRGQVDVARARLEAELVSTLDNLSRVTHKMKDIDIDIQSLKLELEKAFPSLGHSAVYLKDSHINELPKLEPQAAELLSTPEIVKARASLTHELKARSDTQTHDKPSSVPSVTQSEAVPLEVLTVEAEKTEKHPVPTEELQIVDKSVIQEEPRNETRPESQKVPSKTVTDVVEDKDEDDWLKEDTSENVNVTGTSKVPIDNAEDVSFSDLVDDDDGDAPTSYTKTASRSLTADHAGQKDSDGWLDVDDIDVA